SETRPNQPAALDVRESLEPEITYTTPSHALTRRAYPPPSPGGRRGRVALALVLALSLLPSVSRATVVRTADDEQITCDLTGFDGTTLTVRPVPTDPAADPAAAPLAPRQLRLDDIVSLTEI